MKTFKTWNEIRKINSKISSIEIELMREQQRSDVHYGTVGRLSLVPIYQANRVFRDTEKSFFLREELDSLYSEKELLKAG